MAPEFIFLFGTYMWHIEFKSSFRLVLIYSVSRYSKTMNQGQVQVNMTLKNGHTDTWYLPDDLYWLKVQKFYIGNES